MFIEQLTSVNILAAIISTVLLMGLGFLWYSPILFGNLWMKLQNFDKNSVDKSHMKSSMIMGLLTTYIIVIMLAAMHHSLNSDLAMSLQYSVIIWIFVALVQIDKVIWTREPISLFVINTLHTLVSYVVALVAYAYIVKLFA